jgi:hypothetical protein
MHNNVCKILIVVQQRQHTTYVNFNNTTIVTYILKFLTTTQQRETFLKIYYIRQHANIKKIFNNNTTTCRQHARFKKFLTTRARRRKNFLLQTIFQNYFFLTHATFFIFQIFKKTCFI